MATPPAVTATTSELRLTVLNVVLAGRAAKRNGEPVESCPYSADAVSADPNDDVENAGADLERLLATYWVRGWSRT